jgi:hypothetical protein
MYSFRVCTIPQYEEHAYTYQEIVSKETLARPLYLDLCPYAARYFSLTRVYSLYSLLYYWLARTWYPLALRNE